jgi:predicted nuclease of restriction endonuclease-like (RecB) superfamily
MKTTQSAGQPSQSSRKLAIVSPTVTQLQTLPAPSSKDVVAMRKNRTASVLLPKTSLFNEIKNLIEQARSRVAWQVNSETTLLYWHIGHRINTDILKNKRADYGQKIVASLARQLKEQFGGSSFDQRNLRRMMQFAASFHDLEIVSSLMTQLSWTHFISVLPLADSVQREFYLTMATSERWDTRTLQEKISGMLYERTLISGKPEKVVRKALSDMRSGAAISPDIVFKSPYFLEFTGLKGVYSEKSLEESLIIHLEQFIMELGIGFAFVERQKRIIIDGEDFHMDLLFYHRKLRRLVAMDLKLGPFKSAYKAQMELYLRWLELNEMQPGEERPLGLILCTEGGREQIELLQLDKSGIRVAQYLTELPSKELLRRELRKSLLQAREQFGAQPSEPL